MKKIYNSIIDVIISVIFSTIAFPLLILYCIAKLIRKILDIIVLITKKSLRVLIEKTTKLVEVVSIKD